MPALLSSHIMPRTTLNLDVAVIHELRRRSSDENIPMGQLASQLLARALKEEMRSLKPASFRWISHDLGHPRVDIDDKEALNSFLDRSG